MFNPTPYYAFYSHFDGYNQRLMETIRSLLEFPVLDVLELGCGIGLSTRALRTAFPDAEITASDQSKSMIGFAVANFPDSRVTYNVADAEVFLRHIAERRFDLVFIKSAYHMFEEQVPLNNLTKVLRQAGAVVIVERTERSAKSYPLFDAARAHWSTYFAAARLDYRLSIARRRGLDLRIGSYGEYVEVPSKIYIDAIRAGQLSFLEPFRREVIESWCESELLKHLTTVLVFEEFWTYIHAL